MITIIVIFHHYGINNEIWDSSPLSYNWFSISGSKSGLPPKDMIANPPRETCRLPSADSDVASVEPPPPRFIGQHRRQRSSWMPPPLHPESKMRAGRPADGDISNGGGGGGERFEDIPLESVPVSSEQEVVSTRTSLGVPGWAKKWLTARRGVGIPFPLTPSRSRHKQGSTSLDVPVTPTNGTDD